MFIIYNKMYEKFENPYCRLFKVAKQHWNLPHYYKIQQMCGHTVTGVQVCIHLFYNGLRRT